jgi:hypothetical protein
MNLFSRQLLIPAAFLAMITVSPTGLLCPLPASAGEEELKVEVTKKGLGKEVLITKGNKEWFMMIEVTPENTVVVRQEKQNETYLVDESETHDRSMTPGEVDVAIEDFINSVRTRVKKGK